jgi:hypothetical protein
MNYVGIAERLCLVWLYRRALSPGRLPSGSREKLLLRSYQMEGS